MEKGNGIGGFFFRAKSHFCCGCLVVLFSVMSSSVTAASATSQSVQQFQKLLKKEILTRWYAVTAPYSKQLPLGALRVHFRITRECRIQVIDVTPNKPNDLLTTLTLKVLTEVKTPPIPNELLTTPNQVNLEVNFLFNVK